MGHCAGASRCDPLDIAVVEGQGGSDHTRKICRARNGVSVRTVCLGFSCGHPGGVGYDFISIEGVARQRIC